MKKYFNLTRTEIILAERKKKGLVEETKLEIVEKKSLEEKIETILLEI